MSHVQELERPPSKVLDPAWIRNLVLESGADDVGFVSLSRPELDDQRDDILKWFPRTRALISYVCRMNREPIRSAARSVANLEFHHTGDQVDEVGRKVVAALEGTGVAAVNPAMGFPMEMDQFPGKLWVVSHKPVAQAAGLGKIGLHRNLIHPKFGNFILLGTILVFEDIGQESEPLDYNPCNSCKLCVAACPVGAIGSDGHFNFSACYNHNYREFMGGFTEWVERVADSRDARQYRSKVTDGESASMWQSLSFGANYKAAYCLAVCPAGEDVIGPYQSNKKQFMNDTLRPLRKKVEPLYVVPGSDAEDYAAKHFPHKPIRKINGSLRPGSIQGFLNGLPLVFQRNKAKDLDCVYHFTFTGEETRQATVVIRNKQLEVEDGHQGTPNLRVTADSRTWLDFLAKNKGLFMALMTRKVILKGSPKLLLAFGRCFNG